MSSRKLVVAAVIVDDLDAPGRVLATRRSRPVALAGQVWLAVAVHGVPAVGDSHDLVRWVSADELTSLDWLDADVAVAAQVAAQRPGMPGRHRVRATPR